jgi:dolichol kinase
MSFSNDCSPFSEQGKRGQIAVTDELSPRLGQFRLISKFTGTDNVTVPIVVAIVLFWLGL